MIWAVSMAITNDELEELNSLRQFKLMYESKGLNRAFARLEQLMDMAAYDPVMSIRAFRVIAECLMCLKETLE